MNKLFRFIAAVLGCSWLLVFAFAGIVIFMDINGWEQRLLGNGRVEILDKYNGGKVIYEIPEKGYLILIHEPVRDSFFKGASHANIQVDWLAEEKLPDRIARELDIDGDGRPDIRVGIDVTGKQLQFTDLNAAAAGLLDRGSLAGVRFKKAESGQDALFFYKNFQYGKTVYKDCLTIRIIEDKPE